MGKAETVITTMFTQSVPKIGHKSELSHLAQVRVLPLLEIGLHVASAQLYVAQNDGERSVVDSAGVMHVQLVHGSLATRSKVKFKIVPFSGNFF